MNKIYALMVIIITIVTILSGCVIPPKVQPDLNQTIQIEPDTGQPKSENMPKPGEKASIEKKTANAKPMYSNPQSYQVTRTLVIKNDTATISSLRVWLPNIASLECQKDYVSQNTNPNIINQWKDPQVDTSISFWEFSNRPAKNSSLTITDQFEYTCFEINCADFPEQIPSYDKSDPEYTLFTRSEKYIESNDTKIVNTAKEIAGTNTNPVQIARLFYDWVIGYLSYKEPTGLRGAALTLANRSGNCGDYSALFIALCRAIGIPARPIVGRWATSSPEDWHVWAEFYVPQYGWVPVDPTIQDSYGGNLFGHIDNKRLIFNKQYNIDLHPSPQLIRSEQAILQAFIWEYSGFPGNISADLSYTISPVAK